MSTFGRMGDEKSPYWQHNEPLDCPKGHPMIWLGSAFRVCEKCHQVYVQQVPREEIHGVRTQRNG